MTRPNCDHLFRSVFINERFAPKKITFLLPSIGSESIGLDVLNRLLVDVETELGPGQTWP